jgi:prophage antirepressor-like protein
MERFDMPETAKPIGIADFDAHFFQGTTVRVHYRHGVCWMVLADVCGVLGLQNPAQVALRLEADEKGITLSETPGGQQTMIIVGEAGVYRLITRSRKRIAKEFQRWIFHSVLPEIRRNGGYNIQNEAAPSLAGITAEGTVLAAMKIVSLHVV